MLFLGSLADIAGVAAFTLIELVWFNFQRKKAAVLPKRRKLYAGYPIQPCFKKHFNYSFVWMCRTQLDYSALPQQLGRWVSAALKDSNYTNKNMRTE